MSRRWSIGLQVVLFAGLIAASVGLWLARDQVNQAVAAFRQSGENAEAPRRRGNRQRGRRGVPVIVTRVTERANDETISAVGTGRARRAVMLMAKADGQIVSFRAQAGDYVQSGETLFTIDNKQAELALELAQRKLEDAERLMKRSTYLKSRRVNSAAPVEDRESAYRQARLELQRAEKVLQDLTVTAPFDGILGIPRAETGDRVTVTTPVVSLDDRSALTIEFDVPERFLPQMKVGGRLVVRTPAYRDEPFEGEIASIDSRIDATTRSITVRATVPNEGDRLRPGMSFVVTIELKGETFAAVPELALQWRGGESFVWLVSDKRAKKVTVKAVRRLNQAVLISGPVAVGDLVVVEGVQRLRPDRPVTFELPDTQSAADSTRQAASANGRRTETSATRRTE
ncbi:MAG: efflux RND transporter periplasmic adaptor subunit [Pseudomonadota bacterium]